MDNHLYQIFDDQNTDLDKGVKFSAGNVLNVRPEWWGADASFMTYPDLHPYPGGLKEKNSQAIERAVNSHIDHTTNVRFAVGKYWLARSVVLRGHINLYGEGGKSGLGPLGWPMSYIITDSPPIDGKQGGEIRGMSLASSGYEAAGPTNVINLSHGTSNWLIADNSIYSYASPSSPGNPPGWAIYLDGASNVTIENNNLLGVATGIIYMKGSNIKVGSNDMQMSKPSESGVHLNQCGNCSLAGNVIFSGGGNTTPSAIIVENSPTAKIIGNKTDFTGEGIRIVGSGGEIRDNIFELASSAGMYLINLSNTTITGNFMSSSDDDHSGENGIVAEGTFGNNVTIKDNYVGDAIRGGRLGRSGYSSYFPAALKFINFSGTFPNMKDNQGVDDMSDFPVIDANTEPSVAAAETFQSRNASPVTISNFKEASAGKEITIIFRDGNTTVKFQSNANLFGNGGIDWLPGVGDHMRCKKTAASWSCNCFDNTP